ncbi:UNVERIFIED_CONTAM: Cytochrome P450 3A24 [Trichonephila clavipes]
MENQEHKIPKNKKIVADLSFFTNHKSSNFKSHGSNEIIKLSTKRSISSIFFPLEDYQVGSYTIPKGGVILSPVWDIHRDPKSWPDPWKFDPDRFSLENNTSLNTMAYMTVGIGRRNCIGSRFAQLEAKLAIFRLVEKFKFETCEKTEDPLPLVCPTRSNQSNKWCISQGYTAHYYALKVINSFCVVKFLEYCEGNSFHVIDSPIHQLLNVLSILKT